VGIAVSNWKAVNSRAAPGQRGAIVGGSLIVQGGIMEYLSTEPNGDVLIVRFTAARVFSRPEQSIAEELAELVNPQTRKILLDFAGVEFVSSVFLGRLLGLERKCESEGIALRLCNLSPGLSETINMMHLEHLLHIHSDSADALAAFSG
jgi:anti-sigma B factor antagonist